MGLAMFFLAIFLARVSCASCWKIGRWALPVMQVLWTNCHPSFLLGPLVALLFALDAQLGIAGGFVYALNCRDAATSSGGAFCASDIGGGCGSSGCGGSSSSSDSGGSDGGGGCGGGGD